MMKQYDLQQYMLTNLPNYMMTPKGIIRATFPPYSTCQKVDISRESDKNNAKIHVIHYGRH